MPMTLHHSPASPFVRKVMAVAIIRGLDGQIETIATNPHVSPEGLLAANPLSKIPCLVLEDGTAVFDSAVICDVLDRMGDAPALIPANGQERTRVLVLEALADGIMDAAVARRGFIGQPMDEGRTRADSRYKATVQRGLAAIDVNALTELHDLGAIAVACALGYLDFRFAHEPWREAHPALATWYEAVDVLPALSGTRPPEA